MMREINLGRNCFFRKHLSARQIKKSTGKFCKAGQNENASTNATNQVALSMRITKFHSVCLSIAKRTFGTSWILLLGDQYKFYSSVLLFSFGAIIGLQGFFFAPSFDGQAIFRYPLFHQSHFDGFSSTLG